MSKVIISSDSDSEIEESLPAGWSRKTDGKQVWYQDKVNKKTQWGKPTEPATSFRPKSLPITSQPQQIDSDVSESATGAAVAGSKTSKRKRQMAPWITALSDAALRSRVKDLGAIVGPVTKVRLFILIL